MLNFFFAISLPTSSMFIELPQRRQLIFGYLSWASFSFLLIFLGCGVGGGLDFYRGVFGLDNGSYLIFYSVHAESNFRQ